MIIFFLSFTGNAQKNIGFSKEGLKRSCGFIENKGQIIDQNNKPNPAVLYLLNTPGMNVQLRKTGFSYDVYAVHYKPNPHPLSSASNNNVKPLIQSDSLIPEFNFHRIDFDLQKINPDYIIETSGRSADYLNYYTAGVPAGGVSFICNFQRVTYKNIYSNIDLELLTDSQQVVKYNFVIHPGGEVKSIRICIKGPEIEMTESGSLRLKTTNGTIEETIPFCYAIDNADTLTFHAKFKKLKESVYQLNFTEEIPSNRILVIDPIPVRQWATYLGGEATDGINDCYLDADRHLYVYGFTNSTMNIATAGTYQGTFAGNRDTFIAKFTSLGNRIWGTYYGGADLEGPQKFAHDNTGHIYITGQTASTAGISTIGSHQPVYGGGYYDGFLAKFDTLGQRIWATYYGGSNIDQFSGCRADYQGNIYVVGWTYSNNNISTLGCHQPALGGNNDGIIVKFNEAGIRQWATYYGGTYGDGLSDIAIDQGGMLVLIGSTQSGNNIATAGSYQSTLGNTAGGGVYDAFFCRFTTDGVRLWGTYYGGLGNEEDVGLWTTTDGYLFICGSTLSNNGISTPGSYQTVSAGSYDDFFAKFDLAGNRIFATYYGGTMYEFGPTITVDENSYIFLSGHTSSDDGIATADGFQTVNSATGTSPNGFVAKFTPTGERVWGTYYGDTVATWIMHIAITGDTLFVVGSTWDAQEIATPGAFQTTLNGVSDGFIVRFNDCVVPDVAGPISGPLSVCTPSSGNIYSVPLITNATSYFWTLPSGATIVSGQNTNIITVDFGVGAVSGIIAVKGINVCGPGELNQLNVQILPRPVPTITGSFAPCVGENKSYTTEAGKTGYVWAFSSGGNMAGGGTGSDNFIDLTWNSSGSQWVKVRYTGENGCDAASYTLLDVTVAQGQLVGVSIAASANSICTGTSVTFTATPVNGGTSPSFQWKVNGVDAGTNSSVYTYIPINGDIITCVLTSSLAICVSNNPALSNPINLVVNPLQSVGVTISPSSNPVCAGTLVNFTAIPVNGGITPQYQWKVNGLIAGTNSPAYSYVPLNGDVITCTLSSNVLCPSGNPAISNTVTISVYPILPVGVSIAASTNPFCSGSPVTFTATPMNGGVSPTYQWTVNGISTGSNNTLFTYNPINGDLVTCSLASSESCTSGNPAQSNPITMLVNATMSAGITIVASSNPFCPGTTVIFTATPGNGGSSPIYQWIVNGTNAGTNSPIFAYNPANNDSVRCVMTSNLNCVTSNPANSGKIIMIGSLAPNITFATCFDTVTTIVAILQTG